ncbi:MAG: SET domain-containing protein-lysine N-methyltransferase [Bryobacteraceae bacterium]
MAQVPVVITLTPAQRALIRESSGKKVAELSIEPVETGAGWLYAAGEGKFWLLKHADPESYAAAQQNHQPRIDSRYVRFRLKIGASRIHRWGVFADEQIPARRNVIEYVGELVNPVESFRRLKDTTKTYTYRLNEFWRIDGTVGGSGAEFINHSCDPNLRWRKFGEGVTCHSVRPIAAGEELTLDYRFSEKAPQVPCQCGSPHCRGTINVARDGRSKSRIKFGVRGNADGTHRRGAQR